MLHNNVKIREAITTTINKALCKAISKAWNLAIQAVFITKSHESN